MEVFRSKSSSIPQRVQTLAAEWAHLSQIPSQYIQPLHHRPKPSSSYSIPILDLSKSNPSILRSVCREWGAFHGVSHGVSADLVNKMQSAGLRFFAESPVEEKMRYACNLSSAASEGYGSRMIVAKEDGVLDWRDYFDHHTLPECPRNTWRWSDIPNNYR